MKANRWDREWLAWLIKKIIPRKFEMILEIGLTVEHVIDRLMGKLPQLQGWARIFVKTKPGVSGLFICSDALLTSPQQDAVVKDRESKTLRMSIDKLLEVEEHIWSPMYGLKGNIDASIQAVMQDEHGERVVTAPFELKTGRATNISHQAQTALYTLLMSDRYGKFRPICCFPQTLNLKSRRRHCLRRPVLLGQFRDQSHSRHSP